MRGQQTRGTQVDSRMQHSAGIGSLLTCRMEHCVITANINTLSVPSSRAGTGEGRARPRAREHTGLDLPVQGILQPAHDVHLAPHRLREEIRIDKNLVGNVKAEAYGKLLHELAVLLGSFSARHRRDAEAPSDLAGVGGFGVCEVVGGALGNW